MVAAWLSRAPRPKPCPSKTPSLPLAPPRFYHPAASTFSLTEPTLDLIHHLFFFLLLLPLIYPTRWPPLSNSPTCVPIVCSFTLLLLHAGSDFGSPTHPNSAPLLPATLTREQHVSNRSRVVLLSTLYPLYLPSSTQLASSRPSLRATDISTLPATRQYHGQA